MGKTKKCYFYKKQYFVALYETLSSLNTSKLFTKFYESYNSLMNYQKSSNIKDKIKSNVHYDTMTINLK